MPVLTTKQIKASLKAVANWSQRAQTICRTFKFEGFLNSIAFGNHITRVVQNLNHYPDIDIRFDQVTLTFTMHDVAKSCWLLGNWETASPNGCNMLPDHVQNPFIKRQRTARQTGKCRANEKKFTTRNPKLSRTNFRPVARPH